MDKDIEKIELLCERTVNGIHRHFEGSDRPTEAGPARVGIQ